jgi:hypothetical protein
MARYVELRRHTDSDGDALTEEAFAPHSTFGRRLAGDYALLVSSGAQRATQTLACFACVLSERLPEGGRALAVGHSPTNERPCWDSRARSSSPSARGAGVLVVADAIGRGWSLWGDQRSNVAISSAVASTWPSSARSTSSRPARKPTSSDLSSACNRKK